MLSVGFAAAPLAKASQGAPRWAVVIAVLVVLLALYLLLGPRRWRLLRSAGRPKAQQPPAHEPPEDPPS